MAALRPRASLIAGNLALRQQLAVLRRAAPRPRLRPVDRAFWVVLSCAWSRWADTLVVVKPATVIGWHRRGFVRFWARRSRCAGRAPLDPAIVELIVRMVRENPTWSRRRIASELEVAPPKKVAMTRVIRRRRSRPAGGRLPEGAEIAVAVGDACITVSRGFDPELLRDVVAALRGGR